MIRERVRRNLEAVLWEGCEELLRVADSRDCMHPAALERVEWTRLAAHERSRLGESRARLDGRRNRRQLPRRPVAPRHDAQVGFRQPTYGLAQRARRQ